MAIQLSLIVAIGLAWQWSSGRLIPFFVISRPTDVFSHFVSFVTSSEGWNDIWVTIQETFVGYAIGAASGLAVGIVLGLSARLTRIFDPMLVGINGVPHVVFAPLLIILLGIGMPSKIALAAVGVFYLMFYNTSMGIKGVRGDLVNSIRLFGASRLQLLRYTFVPGMMHAIFAGLKGGLPFALVGAIVGEFVGATAGLGFFITRSTSLFDASDTFAGMLVLLILSVLFSQILRIFERRAFKWQSTR